MHRLWLGILLLIAGGAQAEKFVLCDDSVPNGVECFATALERAYEYCRQVESIVIIEYGMEEANEGTNGAKVAACSEKYQRDLKPSYLAALKELAKHRGLTERVREAHSFWAESVGGLVPRNGESGEEYKARVAERLQALRDRAAALKQDAAEHLAALAAKVKNKTAKKS